LEIEPQAPDKFLHPFVQAPGQGDYILKVVKPKRNPWGFLIVFIPAGCSGNQITLSAFYPLDGPLA